MNRAPRLLQVENGDSLMTRPGSCHVYCLEGCGPGSKGMLRAGTSTARPYCICFEAFQCHHIKMMKHILLPILLVFATAVSMLGQSPSPPQKDESRELTRTIAKMDAQVFDAFNAHKVDPLMAMFTDDLEFYHDQGGLTNYEQTAENFRRLFADMPDIRRELVLGSFEVYAIKDYGAIEIGAHRFCHKKQGKKACGTFRFFHIWRKSGDTWKISRVISYGNPGRGLVDPASKKFK